MSNAQNDRKGHTEHNKPSKQPTPRHESRRTPESRHDRDTHVGSGNQAQARRTS